MPTIRVGEADIYYETQGEGDPVLWIMGLGLDSRMMLMFTAAFPQFRNIVLDNRGTGRSAAPSEPVTMEQMAADALAVLDELGIEQAHVVGMSLGGAIAQHLALKAPERVRSLVLCCTWAGPNEWHRRLDELSLLEAEKIGYDAILKHTLLLLFSPKYVLEQPAVVSTFEAMGPQMVAPMDVFFAQTAAAAAHDVRDRLGSLTMPTLVMTGDRDQFVPRELGEEIAALVPGATLKMYQGGHAFMLEDAAAFTMDLTAFLTGS